MKSMPVLDREYEELTRDEAIAVAKYRQRVIFIYQWALRGVLRAESLEEARVIIVEGQKRIRGEKWWYSYEEEVGGNV